MKGSKLKNTPANRGKCRGVLWVGLQTMAIRPRFRPDLNLFSGKTGNLHGFERIFGDMRGVSRDLKKTAESGGFFRIGRDFGRKRPESVHFTDSRIGRRIRFPVFDADNPPRVARRWIRARIRRRRGRGLVILSILLNSRFLDFSAASLSAFP